MNTPGKTLASFLLSAFAGLSLVGAAEAWELQWFGQSAVKITTPGEKIIVIDPFITQNPKTPENLKDLRGLGKVDLILLTHGHRDHLGDTGKIAGMTGAKVGLNSDLGHTLETLGIVPAEQIIPFNKSGSITPLPGVTITMTPAEHSSDVMHAGASSGEQHVYPGGEPAGYIIELENGFKVYHAGDTGVFADMKFIGEYYRPDLALLPIDGHFTMDPALAAYALKNLLKTKRVIPIHYGTFPLLKGTPDEFKEALGKFPVQVIVMEPGEKRKF